MAYYSVSFVKMCLTLPSIVAYPMLRIKLSLRFMWFDLIDLNKWDISLSKLLDYGGFPVRL